MSLFRRRNTEADFWTWFQENQAQIAAIATGSEPIIPALQRQLGKVNSGLVWEMGRLKDGRHDFVAGGIRKTAPAVRSLVAVAPDLPGWQITAFRPIREPDSLSCEGVPIDPQNVYVGLMSSPSGGPFNLVVLLPGLTDENRRAFQNLAFLLLDGFLGEEAVMDSVGEVHIQPNTMDRPAHCVPIAELRASLNI